MICTDWWILGSIAVVEFLSSLFAGYIWGHLGGQDTGYRLGYHNGVQWMLRTFRAGGKNE